VSIGVVKDRRSLLIDELAIVKKELVAPIPNIVTVYKNCRRSRWPACVQTRTQKKSRASHILALDVSPCGLSSEVNFKHPAIHLGLEVAFLLIQYQSLGNNSFMSPADRDSSVQLSRIVLHKANSMTTPENRPAL